MTFFEAAVRALEFAGGGPLHYKDIARIATENGLLKTSGLTPEATLGATLYSRDKRARQKGEEPKVRLVGKGTFALSKRTRKGIAAQLGEADEQVKTKLHASLHEMNPQAFERLIAGLLVNIGFEEVETTQYSNDKGLDVNGELTVGGVTSVKTAIQVKRWKNNVPSKTVRELRGSLMTDQRGLIVTTSAFTKEALKEAVAAGKTPISLIDGPKLVELLIENELGIKRKSITYLELDLGALEEFEEGTTSDQAGGKAMTLWPMPGGIERYFESIVAALGYIAQAEPTRDELVEWFQSAFPKVKSPKVCHGYINVIRTLGLAGLDGETFTLTDDGLQVLSADGRSVIQAQLTKRISGVVELLERFEAGPLTVAECQKFLKKVLKADWKTDAQTVFRLRWLTAVGAIVRKENRYSVSELRH